MHKIDGRDLDKLAEIIETLDEIGVDVLDVEHVCRAEIPIDGHGGLYEGTLEIQWKAD